MNIFEDPTLEVSRISLERIVTLSGREDELPLDDGTEITNVFRITGV